MHPDNYIPGNSLVLPISINSNNYIYIIILYIIIILIISIIFNKILLNNNNNNILKINNHLINNNLLIINNNKLNNNLINNNNNNKLNNIIIKRNLIYFNKLILINSLFKTKRISYMRSLIINIGSNIEDKIIKDYNLLPLINNKNNKLNLRINNLLLNINLLTSINSNKDIINNLLKISLKQLEIIKLNNLDFRNLINGLFQAEGHIGYEFYTPLSYKGRPLVFIQLNASLESILLFKQLNNVFNNKINYIIYLNKSGIYSIRIYSRNIDFIINHFKPYINNIYGDKFRGLLFLIKINYLLNIILIDNIIKIIYLAYNLVDNSQRKINYQDKLNIVLNKNNIINIFNNNNNNYNNILNNYINNIIINNINHYKFNICWLLGFFLGDGSLNTFIRDTNKLNISLPYYVLVLNINQKNTKENIELLNIISNNLINKYNIKTILKISKDNKKYELSILNIIELEKLIKLFNEYIYYWYLRKHQLSFLSKILLVKKSSKYWIILSLLRINLLKEFIILQYNNRLLTNSNKIILININDIKLYLNNFNINYNIDYIKLLLKFNNKLNKYYFPIYLSYSSLNLLFSIYYYNNIINIFNNKYNNYKLPIFIHYLNNNKGYSVSLPIKLKPKIKYFYFSLNINSLNLAIKYKNDILFKWLIDNKLLL